jgi:hypothetical protein
MPESALQCSLELQLLQMIHPAGTGGMIRPAYVVDHHVLTDTVAGS